MTRLLLVVLLVLAVMSSLSFASKSHSPSLQGSNKRNAHHRVLSRAADSHDKTNSTKTDRGKKSKSSKSSSSSSSTKSKSSSSGGSDLVGDSSDKNFTLNNLPKSWQSGQSGTNQCTQWGKSSQESMCQNAFFNSLDDFCLWAPPTPGTIGDTERIEVSWCTKPGYGTRLIPAGAIQAAHFLQTKEYVQVTGTGDLTLINIPSGDTGGELDPHGADGNGNPIGGLVFSNAFDAKYRQIHEWMLFVSDSLFCFRACKGRDKTAQNLCQHIYDTMGCDWVMPGNYGSGFDSCDGNVAKPPGIVGTSTFTQGDAVTPSASPAPASSNCKAVSTISAAITVSTTVIPVTTSTIPGPGTTGTLGGNALAAGNSSTSNVGGVSSATAIIMDLRPLLGLVSVTIALISASLILF